MRASGSKSRRWCRIALPIRPESGWTPDIGVALNKNAYRQVDWTHHKMTEWWGYDKKLIKDAGQFSGGYIRFNVASPRWRRVLSSWLACAQDRWNCMMPEGAYIRGPPAKEDRTPGVTYVIHRDDQSAMTYALFREFGVEGALQNVSADMQWNVQRGQQCDPWPADGNNDEV